MNQRGANLRSRLERRDEAAGRPSRAADGEPPDSTLTDLRRQMQMLMERTELDRSPAERLPRARSFSSTSVSRQPLEELPFASRSGAAGEYWQRISTFSPGHQIGRVALGAVAQAEASALAELALDARVAACAASSWLFLDLETTGFIGAGTLAFLIGMAGLDASGNIVVEQLLLRDPSEEPALLARVADRVEAASLIISFNGKAFDRPLLDGRYTMNRMLRLPERTHLDLLHIGRRLHRRRLQNCSLKRMERDVLGFDRGEDIDGSEVAAIYSHFLRTSDSATLSRVVHHNAWDVVSMVALVALYGQRPPPLVPQDLASLAHTLLRAGATRYAESVADAACARGGGKDAFRVRAALCKSRGDALGAIRDLERLCREGDDPVGRLELAKLYEHEARRPACALRWAEQGTSEDARAHARRLERLKRKISRNPTA